MDLGVELVAGDGASRLIVTVVTAGAALFMTLWESLGDEDDNDGE